jgi:hypothetical protein
VRHRNRLRADRYPHLNVIGSLIARGEQCLREQADAIAAGRNDDADLAERLYEAEKAVRDDFSRYFALHHDAIRAELDAAERSARDKRAVRTQNERMVALVDRWERRSTGERAPESRRVDS